MRTYRQLVYLVLDELKLMSDDSSFTEDHIIFLLNKYRTFLLKQRYSDVRKEIPLSNYQTLCLSLEKHEGIEGLPCEDTYMRSTKKIPKIMNIGQSRVHSEDYFNGEITYVSRDRLRYVGHNKYLKNIIYASIGPDNYLYLKSSNPQYLYLEKARITGIFEDPQAALELQCPDENGDTICDVLDKNFPIEDALIPPIIELVVKELLGAEYRPKDDSNDANDALADLATFLRNNVKSNLQKQIEG